ncbi:unnamed protein product [Rhizoctonia solani]|uniref:Uncharacterized protein n=1 Tax=Rhizoctonia solani TaxID=456999 RepID=A0A8H3C2R1_9AGAM|nr:unnamed protein product [Rhizoctonia solani]
MERPPIQLKEPFDESDGRSPHSQQPRRNSLTPSIRRERPALRSSPLAGPSYSADGAGNVVEHTSALEEEIARRRTALPGFNDEDLARLANLPPSTPALSHSSSPNPSRKGSLETTEEPQTRHARPSFISLEPQGSRPGSRGSLAPPTPTSPTLRARHSSPHLAVTANPKPDPGPANWMTAAPAPSFSRTAVRGSGVVLPVKASSKAGERIRKKSTPNQLASAMAKPDAQVQHSTKPRSLKSFRSMSRILRGSGTNEHEREIPPTPTPLSPRIPRSRASSFESGASSLDDPVTPDESDNKDRGRFSSARTPAIADPDAKPPPFSERIEAAGLPAEKLALEGGGGGVKRLWSKVRKWRAHA